VWGGVFPSHLGGAIFCFVISNWHILANSGVLNLVFLYRELSQWVRVDSVANFGFSSKAMNKRHH